LVVGDEVVLLRMQGGQKYIVLDRVVSWYHQQMIF
jgi:hypothetical protein